MDVNVINADRKICHTINKSQPQGDQFFDYVIPGVEAQIDISCHSY